MSNINQIIENHYNKTGLYEDIVKRLEEQGIDLNNVNRKDIAGVDEFHVRGAEVSKELADLINLNDAKVLDVGCGLGGPCRMLADDYNCTSTGIDMSSEYIRTAGLLSKLVKLDDKTVFVHGDANNLPFEDNSFDVVWTQHVQMNIEDKKRFYSEIHRVLKSGGHFIYYDIFKRNGSAVTYPMPWADGEDISFLAPSPEMKSILLNLNMQSHITADQTDKGITFFEGLLEKIKQFGPPKIGLNVLMGESTKPKLINLLNGLKEQTIMLESGVYKK